MDRPFFFGFDFVMVSWFTLRIGNDFMWFVVGKGVRGVC